MSNNIAAKLAKSFVRALKKHSPAILTGIAVAGTFAATAAAIKATPKAVKLIEQKKDELGVDKLTPVETVKTVWKEYVPTVALCVTSAACGITSNAINAKRGAVLGAALTLSETALLDYQKKAVEVVGESGEKAIRDAVAKEQIEQKPVAKKDIIDTSKGNTLCYDSMSGRYFKSDTEQIKKAEYRFNKSMLYDSYGSLNDFYDVLGLPNILVGDELGWNCFSGRGMEVKFSSQLAENDTPCLVLNYSPQPHHDYEGR